MINKGTVEYKQAQAIANKLTEVASYHKSYNGSIYNVCLGSFIDTIFAIKQLDVFAAKIADTVWNSIDKGGRLARISPKQSWILACAVVENNLEVTI